MVSHNIQHNQTYESLEKVARIINSTPGAVIQVPATKYKIKKQIDPVFTTEFHIKCTNCKVYEVTTVSKPTVSTECKKCGLRLTTANCDHLVYIPIKEQLSKIIADNYEKILSYHLDRRNSENGCINDIHDSINFKTIQDKYADAIVLSLVVCTDGVQVHNSSNKSLWAIQLYQNFLHPKTRYIPGNILVVALHHGNKPNMKEFFYPLLNELKSIQDSGGLSVERGEKKTIFMPYISQCCCDLPAKADVQGMVQHNGRFSCGFCMHPGEATKTEKSKSYIRYTRQTKISDRTHKDMLEIYKVLKTQPINGVKSVSCLVAAKNFNLVFGFCIDYMHCVLLGLVKKHCSLFMDSSNHKQPYYIKPKDQKILNMRLEKIKPTSDISRKPRPLSEIGKYKANEYRSLLFYYLPCLLPGLLPKRYVDHFMLLSSAIYMLLEKSIPVENIDIAERQLEQYANEFETLYGKVNVTMNLHLVRHAANSVRYNGPLWAQSAFAFEGNNGELQKINSTNNILHSMAWKYAMKSTFKDTHIKNEKLPGLIVGGEQPIQISQREVILQK